MTSATVSLYIKVNKTVVCPCNVPVVDNKSFVDKTPKAFKIITALGIPLYIDTLSNGRNHVM